MVVVMRCLAVALACWVAVGMTFVSEAQDRYALDIDTETSLRLLSWPHIVDGQPVASGWRAKAAAGVSGTLHFISTDNRTGQPFTEGSSAGTGFEQALWGRLGAGFWSGQSFLHTQVWAAVNPIQGPQPQVQPDRTPTRPLRFGHVLEASISAPEAFSPLLEVRWDAGYEGLGPSVTQLFARNSVNAFGMTAPSPFGYARATLGTSLRYIDEEDLEHRWLYVHYTFRYVQREDALAPTTSLTEHVAGFSFYAQRFHQEGFRDTGFDVLPIRIARSEFDASAVRPSQSWIEICLAKGQAMIHGQGTTFSARGHLGWRFIDDNQHESNTISVIALLGFSVDRPNWGLSLDGSRDAASGADSAGMISQDQFQGRLDIHPEVLPVALGVSAAYAWLSDMEFDTYYDDSNGDRPQAKRGWVKTELAWTDWQPWRVSVLWATGFGPSPERSVWRPWALPTQQFNDVTLSLSWQPLP
jgi:hypothetical protein